MIDIARVSQYSAPRLPQLKLAMVMFRYFPWGGMQANFLRIARACVARGHQVDVYTLDWQGERPEGVKINIVEVKGRQNITRYGHFCARMRQIVDASNYALVMGFNRMPNLDLYYAADPCFVERVGRTRPWYYPLTARYRHFRGIEKRVFGQQSSTQILALSAQQIEDYVRHYATPRERFKLLPPGVPMHYRWSASAPQLRQEFRFHYHINENDWVLLMIGSGFKLKGVDRGIRAFAALPLRLRNACRLFIVGKGREKPFLKLAARLGLDNHLTIIPGSDQIPLFLQGADVLMHPARSENTGNVIVEAIAAGLAVLCSATCGYAQHVSDAGAGRVLDEPFKQANMNAMLAAMLDRKKIRQQQRNALAYAGRTDLYSRTACAIDIIEGLARKQGRCA